LNDFNLTNIIFDFVGHISPIFNIIPTQCYIKNKTEILKIDKYIINDNQDVITSTIKRNHQDVTMYKLNKCIMYEREHISFESTYIYYEFEISTDLTNTVILNYLIDIDRQFTFNANFITFKYLNWNVRGTLLSYDIEKHTITINIDYATQQSNPYPTRRITETFNIDSIRECVLKYKIIPHYKNTVELDVYNDK
jgi:hypothetical protein